MYIVVCMCVYISMYVYVCTCVSVYFYVCVHVYNVHVYELVEHFICILFHASSFSPASVVNESLPRLCLASLLYDSLVTKNPQHSCAELQAKS